MTYISVQVDKRSQVVRQGLQNLNNEFPKVGRLQLYRTAQRIQKRMRTPGQPVTYPINWDSEKQRRAYFATDGFGRGIPYKRTGSYEQGWIIAKTDTGYRLVNAWGGARYVGGTAFGPGQSNIHRGRWPLLRNVFDEEVVQLPQDVQNSLVIAARRGGLDVKSE